MCGLWRDRDGRASVDAGCVEDCSRDRLIAWGGQSESVGPGVGPGIRRREVVVDWKDGGGIGTGEVNVAIDDGIGLTLVNDIYRNCERDARCRGGRSAELEGR